MWAPARPRAEPYRPLGSADGPAPGLRFRSRAGTVSSGGGFSHLSTGVSVSALPALKPAVRQAGGRSCLDQVDPAQDRQPDELGRHQVPQTRTVGAEVVGLGWCRGHDHGRIRERLAVLTVPPGRPLMTWRRRGSGVRPRAPMIGRVTLSPAPTRETSDIGSRPSVAARPLWPRRPPKIAQPPTRLDARSRRPRTTSSAMPTGSTPRPFRSCMSLDVDAHAGAAHHPTHGPTHPRRSSTPARRGRRPQRRWLRVRGHQGPWRTAGAAPGHLPHAGPRRGAHSPRRVTSVFRQVPPALTGPFPLPGKVAGSGGAEP
jgi:hypothetical protein